MFRSLKIYKDQSIDLDFLLRTLVDFGYHRQDEVREEGDFRRYGAIVDIYPATFDCPIRIEFDYNKVSSIASYNIITGKVIWKHTMVIILPRIKTQAARSSDLFEEMPLHNFIDIEKGDYVVHVKHGIGRFLGIEKVKIKNVEKDHLAIEYANNDRIYVPVEQAHLVQKYISFEGRSPRLYRLGSGEWKRIKERARKGLLKVALDLLEMQAKRQTLSGFKFSKDTDWQKQFEETFAFEETPDQINSTSQVKADMESSRPMDRLLCGDVGYGKTEVAMRACFKATMDNKQVAFLVPTTILAEQHYQNFIKRLKDFPVNVAMLSRFKTKSEQKAIIKDLAEGKIDIIIGTHRLISDDIKFKNLGLLIIDEEQKFGVKAKERLKKIRLLVDVLTLTATPIPRTLYMSLMGAKDFSVINTPPQNRIPIETHVEPFSKDLIKTAIERELSRRGQVYFIHNRVEDIEDVRDLVKNLSPNKTCINFAHGQMPAKILEKIMISFLNGEVDILVSTNIIESGIDVPNANTIIVNNADTFGLSDLHQLRGRVGRFNRKAYAYFLIPRDKPINYDAQKRLEAIEKYSELGAGFKIAMEDLEIRGAGNLLGLEQHGYIMAVGFDLYCRLIRQAVAQLKDKAN
ncbi:MAG: transcription-repair coupling factor [Candidatus Omnitrophica bacterium]|nr:transcription-repair coupling factor [Candidatus Omnitrophota bacterium]MDD5352589.1 transcription-repair coupling factor [Candidatus Omnitrophota bacterium]MDD5550187.1 transcription-repair coupling factor [Candidatus Omnitrophota bacterium]